MRKDNVEDLWEHLHWLVVLHQQGSFSKAAARLGVSKASMSQHITDLEKAAGITLVQRTTRSASLTDAGRQMVESMRGAFEQIATGYAQVRDLAGAPRGFLRVTAPVAFARQQLVPRLPDFLHRYPQIQLELDMSDRLRPLAQEGFDIAVRHTSTPPETHVAWTLAATRAVLVASRAYLRSRGAPETPEALSGHACLHYPRLQGTTTWTFVPAVAAPNAGHADPVTVPVTGPCPSTTAKPCAMPQSRDWASRSFRLQRPIGPGNRSARRGPAGMALHGRLRRLALRHPPLLRACFAGLAGLRGVLARDLRTRVLPRQRPT